MKLTDAVYKWVDTINLIPRRVVEKLMEYGDTVREITPIVPGDEVLISHPDIFDQRGEVIGYSWKDGGYYIVRLETDDEDVADEVAAPKEDLTVIRADDLPIWRYMFSFSETIDDDWLEGRFGTDGLRIMAEIGFRIYEQEDYGYIFGFGVGESNSFKKYWIPLYKARGMHWHDEDDTEDENDG